MTLISMEVVKSIQLQSKINNFINVFFVCKQDFNRTHHGKQAYSTS